MQNSLNSSFLSTEELSHLNWGSLGERVLIHNTAILVNTDRMFIGNDVRIDGVSCLSAGSRISIGNHVHVSTNASLVGAAEIALCDYCNLSQGVRIFSSSDDYSGLFMTNPTNPIEFRNVDSREVEIGRHAIVGAGSVVLPGANIGEGSAVGALSLVKEPLAPWGIYAGVPAQRIKDRRKDLLKFEAQQ